MSDTVSVQGVIVDKWAYTQAFNGGVGNGMTKERKRVFKIIDDLIFEAQTLQYPGYEQYIGAYEYAKYKIEEKYLNRIKNKENANE
jgi:hypothetical protein